MKTIIRVNHPDGTKQFVQRTIPTITYTNEEQYALQMDFQQAMRISLALATLNIGHCMITKSQWDAVETKHNNLTEE